MVKLTRNADACRAIALAPPTDAFLMWLIDHTWIENRRQVCTLTNILSSLRWIITSWMFTLQCVQGLIAIALACMAVVTVGMAFLLATVM